MEVIKRNSKWNIIIDTTMLNRILGFLLIALKAKWLWRFVKEDKWRKEILTK